MSEWSPLVKLPPVSGRDLIKLVKKLGFKMRKRGKTTGSHTTYVSPDGKKRVTLDKKQKHYAPGTLNSIIRQLDMTKEDFVKEIEDL